MDFKQLLQLAGENSTFAKKKFDRLNAKVNGESNNVSSSAVAKYLAKQKHFKDKLKVEEEEARKKRIQARIQASTSKKKPAITNQPKDAKTLEKNNKEKPQKDVSKVKVDSSFKKQSKVDDKISEHHSKSNSKKINAKLSDQRGDKHTISSSVKPRSKQSNERASKKKRDKNVVESNSEEKHCIYIDHRKEVNRTQPQRNDKTKNKSATTSSNGNLSFSELMKLAKSNAKHAGTDGNKLKRPLPKTEEVTFDPDRYVKTKVKRKEKAGPSHREDKHVLPHREEKHKKKLEQKYNVSDKMKRKKEHIQESKKQKSYITSSQPIKRGLVTETISSTRSIAPQARGIASQNRYAMKQRSKKTSVNDMEDEFEKEERALARKRKLFEMRLATGNRNLEEEDLYDCDEDYDLDEEDEEDENFIDDSEVAGNVSKHIRSIFGYDKRRYDDSDDDDLANMESNYSQIEKEEARSSRIGKIEDAYEKMKEQEMEQRQKMRAKKIKS